MKYPLTVSGLEARSPAGIAPHQTTYGPHTAPLDAIPVVRRFPPALQFLTRAEPYVESQLQAAALHAFKQGRRVDQICGTIYHTALSLGYHVTIGVQEVYSASMPSFPGETVLTALLLIDIRDLGSSTHASPAFS
jgi:hypothetical protein